MTKSLSPRCRNHCQRWRGFLLLGLATFAGCLAGEPTGGLKASTIRVEAETAFVVRSDSGENGPIGVASGELDSGDSVKLYDAGDSIALRVSVPVTMKYRVALRVRAGGSEDPKGFWPDGYRLKIDGRSFDLHGEEDSISTLDESYGGCFWGTMSGGSVVLSGGPHTIEIAANAVWAVVDYIEFIPDSEATAVAPTSPGLDTKQTHATMLEIVARVELEAPLVVTRDAGPNGAIAVADGQLDSNESVGLYDAGDAVRAIVNVPQAGVYRIEVRVRCGGSTGQTALWPGGYQVKLDGDVLAVLGEPRSVSLRDESYGGCFWGTMQSEPLKLAPGAHTLDIAAVAEWGVVDYVQLLAVTQSPAAPGAITDAKGIRP